MRSCSSSSAPNRRLPEVSRVDRRDTSLLQEDHSIGGKSPLIHLGDGAREHPYREEPASRRVWTGRQKKLLGRTAMTAWPAGDTAAAGAIADRCRCNRGNAVGDLSVGITR